MEIEKTVTVRAPRQNVWAMLMDPHVMTGAVPGMQSIEVISPTEYVALMKVKISFISAKFKLHTHIVEQREPEYLRAQGTGEDASVASSLKQTSEIFLSETPEGGTELRIKVNVDLLGRLGTFGLSVMKNKADRMWEEFGQNLAAALEGRDAAGAAVGSDAASDVASTAALAAALADTAQPAPAPAAAAAARSQSAAQPGWLARLFGCRRAGAPGQVIRVEVRQANQTVVIEWPAAAADQCQDWLRELLQPKP
jgi:carbon monoxide dehydrogenase subunit G